MPSVSKNTSWFVRVTLSHASIKEKIPEMMQWLDLEKCIAVYHIGEKTEKEHAHIALTLVREIQKQSLDVRFKKLFGVKGAFYSSKEWDRDPKAIAYMFHEKDAPIACNKGYTDDDITKFKDINDSVQKVVAVNRERAAVKLVDRLVEEFKNREDVSEYKLFRYAMDLIRDGSIYHPGMFLLKKYVEQAYINVSTETAFDSFVDKAYQNLFCR